MAPTTARRGADRHGVDTAELVHGIFLLLADRHQDQAGRFQVFSDETRGIHSHEFLTWCRELAGVRPAQVNLAISRLGGTAPTAGDFKRLMDRPQPQAVPDQRRPPGRRATKAANDAANKQMMADMRALGVVS